MTPRLCARLSITFVAPERGGAVRRGILERSRRRLVRDSSRLSQVVRNAPGSRVGS